MPFLLVSKSPHAKALYLDLRSPSDSQLSGPLSLPLGMWELLGMSEPTVRSSWAGPCFIHLPIPSTLQAAGSFAGTSVQYRDLLNSAVAGVVAC